MTIHRTGRLFFEIPHVAVYALMAANIVAYGVCLARSGTPVIPGEIIFHAGAMDALAIQRHEYWRLVTSGFLHFNPVHLAGNMMCLVLWGGHLEKRVGSLYFLIIYLAAMVCGALLQHFTYPGRYLLAGASGATSGILGALLSLWILAKVDLSAGFFVTNIGLNVALAAGVPSIAWRAHAGGLVGGLVACALLDVVEKINALALRCKFPEFVKINLFVIACAAAVLAWPVGPVLSGPLQSSGLLACGIVGLVAVKAIDLVLSMKTGLAVVVVTLSTANAALVVVAGRMLVSALAARCAPPRLPATAVGGGLIDAACANPAWTLGLVASAVFAATLLLYAHPFARGITDVGFVGASLRAERGRRRGI